VTSFAAIEETIMQAQYYTVSPVCTSGGSKLFLTAGSASNVIVDEQSTSDPDSQLWTLVQHFNPNGMLIVSKNLSVDGQALAIDAPSNDAAVKLVPVGALVRGTWNIIDDGAVQLHADPSMNLNVNGSQPIGQGSTVLAWGNWSGASNEVWAFTAEGQATSASAALAHA
jgi:hypothetical protein